MDAAVANLSLSDEPTRRVITSVEDMMPRDVFFIGTNYLTATELPAVAVCNRSFKEAMYQPRIIMYRAAVAFVGQGGPAVAEARIREIIAEDPPTLMTLRLVQSILTMRAMGQLTDDDMSRNETLAAAWRLTEEIPPPAAMVQEIAAGVANVNAEDPDHADRFPTREESYAALGIDPPPPNQDDGEA